MLEPVFNQDMPYVYKKECQIRRNLKTNLLSNWEKPVSEPVNSKQILWKNRFCDTIFLWELLKTPKMSFLNCNKETRTQIDNKKNKSTKLKSFFFFFWKQLFSKSWNSPPVYSKREYWLIYFCIKSQWNVSSTKKTKSKRQLKTKVKKIN